MRHGDSSIFAVEAVPGGYIGSSVAGNIRIFVRGEAYGRFDEPNCALGPTSDHLSKVAGDTARLWNPDLLSLDPDQRFARLDSIFYRGDVEEDPTVADAAFLTHWSEAFDPIKGFVLKPSKGTLQILIKRSVESPIVVHDVPLREVAAVANAFHAWVRERER